MLFRKQSLHFLLMLLIVTLAGGETNIPGNHTLNITGQGSSKGLHCLQYNLGNELTGTKFKPGTVDGRQIPPEGSWIYQSDECPLAQFDKASFCKDAIGCGKRLILVGDSTMLKMIHTIGLLIPPDKITKRSCPNGRCKGVQKTASTRGCVEKDDPIIQMQLCKNECSSADNSQIEITYIRHDHLHFIHGLSWHRSSVCDAWLGALKDFDYALISTGPHVHEMILHPYGHDPPPPGENTTSSNHSVFFEDLTTKVANIIKANHPNRSHPILIFRTGPTGSFNASEDCSNPPHEIVPVIQDEYDWPMVPILNQYYMKNLKAVFEEDIYFMDTMNLMLKFDGCRADQLHFRVDTIATPVLIEWQILQNLLLEIKKKQ